MSEAEKYKSLFEQAKDRCAELNIKLYEIKKQIVRCKDCKYCKIIEGMDKDYWYGSCQYYNTHSVMADDFCSRGERAE